MNEELNEIFNLFQQKELSESGLAKLAELFLNWLMKKERELFLNQSSSQSNKANGYYERQLATLFGNLNLSVPRDRKTLFRPAILPIQWQRFDPSFQHLLLNLILYSFSPSKIKFLLHSLNFLYSPAQLDELKNELYQKAKELRSKELPSDAFALFIDAYHCSIKDEELQRVRKSAIYTCIGIDMQGKKEIYGYYINYGSEKKEEWLKILNDLIERGLKRVLIIVSDDFPGLNSAIKTLFPKTDHQLCIIHLQRNLKRNMSRSDAKQFLNALAKIKLIENYEKALLEFEKLCSSFEKKYSAYMKMLLAKKENYFQYMKYPEEVRVHIKTTNVVENFNSRLEVLRVDSGGYFQNIKTAEIAIFIIADKLQNGK